MAYDLETAVKNAATTIARYVDDVATLTVVTKYVEIGDEDTTGFDAANPVARTTIKMLIDGDSETIIPMRKSKTDGELEVDELLFDIHTNNVQMAIDYRSRMMDALLGLLESRTRGMR